MAIINEEVKYIISLVCFTLLLLAVYFPFNNTPNDPAPDSIQNLEAEMSINSVTLSWSPPDRAAKYSVGYQLTNKYQCDSAPGVKMHIEDVQYKNIELVDLFSYSTYEIAVTAVNEWGRSEETKITVTTIETRGKVITLLKPHIQFLLLYF